MTTPCSGGRRPVHVLSSVLTASILSLALVACGGKGRAPAIGVSPSPFEILEFEPDGYEEVFLNQSLRWLFSYPVDIDTANFNAISFTVMDLAGNPLPEQVTGRFRLGLDSQGEEDPRLLEFEPRLPTDKNFSNGGFRAARIYKVKILQENQSKHPVLRDLRGESISASSGFLEVNFRTVSSSTARELFKDTGVGGPHVRQFVAGPAQGGRVALNLLGTSPVEVRLYFDQPLSSSENNLPLGQDRNPVRAASRRKGKIFMEYDDPVMGVRQWIRAGIEIPVNDNRGAEILIRPEGVLPNNATVRVIVEAGVQDLSGESNIRDVTYDRVVGVFRTEEAFGPQFGALVTSFQNSSLIDKDAPFLDPVAEIKSGLLRPSFDFEGITTLFDYVPVARDTVLNTNLALVQPSNGPTLRFRGGVFTFRNIWIREAVKVQGQGSNPLVFLANGSVTIDGHISVDGGDGVSSKSPQPKRGIVAGGKGVCGGGDGGRASQNARGLTLQGETGFGPGQVNSGGGQGGEAYCDSISGMAAGGGGGSMAVQGDPSFETKSSNKTGQGGDGGNWKTTGGAPGPVVFKDKSQKNDFWGRLVTDVGEVIIGELQAPMAGAGGGGGGDAIAVCNMANPKVGVSRRGGGGGAGAGVVIIKALGPIIVNSKGRVSADGGSGGGGEWTGSSRFGGGGGAGSGGMVVLMSATRIDLHTKFETYANKDYNFSVTADGNISRVESYGSLRRTKYPPGNDKSNAGGYGGMGLIQLHTPPGSDADKTGTVLDDNIRVIRGSAALSGAAKTAYLFSGDLRPDPWILPVPYGRFSTAELQWQSTGASVRHESLKPATAGARVIDARYGKSGPQWFFENLVHGSKTGNDGYIQSRERGGLLGKPVTFPGGVTLIKVLSAKSRGTVYHGVPAHVVEIPKGLLSEPLKGGWSYANYMARLYIKNKLRVDELRILSSSGTRLLLDARQGKLPSGLTGVDIVPRFLRVETKGRLGMGAEFAWKVGAVTEHFPKTNIQIGFAFHWDPSTPRMSGSKDLNRFPEELGTFLYGLDLDDSATMEALRKRHYAFAKIRIRFNLNYSPDQPDTTPGPNPIYPGMVRPGIRFLRLPYKF